MGIILWALLLLAAAVFWPGINGPLLLDDYPQLLPLINAGEPVGASWREYWLSETGPLGRPVAMLSFLFNAATSGPDLAAWKYTNLMVHLLTAAVVTWLSALCCMQAGRMDAPTAWMLGTLTGGIWMLHPLHVSTVFYTVQRMTMLSSLFCFIGMLCYVKGRRRQLESVAGGRVWIVAAYLICMPLAAFSKENGLLLPVYLALLELFVFRLGGTVAQRRFNLGMHGLFLLLPFLAGLGFLLLNYQDFLIHRYAGRDFTLMERLLTESRVLMRYIGQILAPSLHRMGFFHDDIPISQGLFNPVTTAGSVIGVAGMIGTAMACIHRYPLVGFGLAMFLSGHLMESTILPLELAFEHRNYLPAWGLSLAGVTVIATIRVPRRLKMTLAVASLGLLALVTSMHAAYWSDPGQLYFYFMRTHPGSVRVLSAMAEQLSVAGQYDRALQLLDRVRTQGTYLQRLHVICRRDGRLSDEQLDDALRHLTRTIDIHAYTGLIEIGQTGLDGDCQYDRKRYLQLLNRAEELGVHTAGSRAKLRIYRAHVLWAEGRNDEAIASLERVVAGRPDDPVPLFLATEWRISQRRFAEAESFYRRARQICDRSYKDCSPYVDRVGGMFSHPEAAAHWLK